MFGMKIWAAIMITLVICASCSKEPLEPQIERVGFDYFPLEKGLFRTYNVEQIDFNVVSSDTSVFQLREVVVDSFLNVENSYTFVLNRFTRANDTIDWELDSVWTARRTNSVAVVIENNVPLVKLTFPIGDGRKWDGNSLNSRPEQEFAMDSVGLPISVSGTSFDESLVVVQSNTNNLIIQDERREVYVRGIGLVMKDFVVLNFCSRDDCLGEGIVDSGQILKMNLVDHGKE